MSREYRNNIVKERPVVAVRPQGSTEHLSPSSLDLNPRSCVPGPAGQCRHSSELWSRSSGRALPATGGAAGHTRRMNAALISRSQRAICTCERAIRPAQNTAHGPDHRYSHQLPVLCLRCGCRSACAFWKPSRLGSPVRGPPPQVRIPRKLSFLGKTK